MAREWPHDHRSLAGPNELVWRCQKGFLFEKFLQSGGVLPQGKARFSVVLILQAWLSGFSKLCVYWGTRIQSLNLQFIPWQSQVWPDSFQTTYRGSKTPLLATSTKRRVWCMITHSFKWYLLSTFYVPGSVLCAGKKTVNKTNSCPHSTYMLTILNRMIRVNFIDGEIWTNDEEETFMEGECVQVKGRAGRRL